MRKATLRHLVVTIVGLVLISSLPTAGQSQDLVELARKEGKVVWYTSVAVGVAEVVAKAFERALRALAAKGVKVEEIDLAQLDMTRSQFVC